MMAKESFVSCAITTSSDGSDDDKINCFKSGQPCAVGKALLQKETRKALKDGDSPTCNDPLLLL